MKICDSHLYERANDRNLQLSSKERANVGISYKGFIWQISLIVAKGSAQQNGDCLKICNCHLKERANDGNLQLSSKERANDIE